MQEKSGRAGKNLKKIDVFPSFLLSFMVLKEC